jgi:hypothetical protein
MSNKKYVMRIVKKIEPLYGGSRGKVWGLTLECGHYVTPRAGGDNIHFVGKTKARCYECE